MKKLITSVFLQVIGMTRNFPPRMTLHWNPAKWLTAVPPIRVNMAAFASKLLKSFIVNVKTQGKFSNLIPALFNDINSKVLFPQGILELCATHLLTSCLASNISMLTLNLSMLKQSLMLMGLVH